MAERRRSGNRRNSGRTRRSRTTARHSTRPARAKINWGGGLYDHSMLFLVLFLVVFGLIMIYSTSYYTATLKMNDSMYYLKRQAIMALAGILFMLLISKVDYRILMKNMPGLPIKWPSFMLFCSILLQIYVLVAGEEYNGAKRWISLGPLGTFQPSDLAKIAIIVYIAYTIQLNPRALDSPKGFIRIAIPVGVDLALIAKENVSTALVLGLILGGVCFIASKTKWYYFLVVLFGIGVGAAILVFGEGFRMSRIQMWLDVEGMEEAFQIRQGLYAVAAGGLFGRGLGQSIQKLGYVPEAQNDWIFSIICEELGMFGACAVIFVFILLLARIFQISINAPDLFGGLIGTGVLIHVAAQVIINIAVVTNSMPSTGVALPFISYGGTSVFILLLEMGLVLSVSNRVRMEE